MTVEGVLNPSLKREINAGTCTLSELFGFAGGYKLSIPDYQRPYVWEVGQVRKLLEDLRDFRPHYLGTILLQRKGDVYELIDGQQRVTTLLMLDAALKGDVGLLHTKGEFLRLYFEAPISKVNLQQNFAWLQEHAKNFICADRRLSLFDELMISVIVTYSADDAFSFFVSQNNRGVTLGPVDFLKSYHLRKLADFPDAQRVLAKSWDQQNRGRFLGGLFEKIIWRGRRWRGKEVAYGEDEDIQQEFQQNTIPGNAMELLFYPGRHSAVSGRVDFSGGETVIEQASTHTEIHPFSLRQPVEKGAGFFLYTGKYAVLYKQLFEEKPGESSPVMAFRLFYDTVYADMNPYLKALFELAVLVYVDQFGERQLLVFALWLDHFLGSYRVMQKSIVSQTPVRICRDKTQNLLDIITAAFRPEEVFDYLRLQTNDSWYSELTGKEGGVRGAYIARLKAFYKKDNLDNKKNWINDRTTD